MFALPSPLFLAGSDFTPSPVDVVVEDRVGESSKTYRTDENLSLIMSLKEALKDPHGPVECSCIRTARAEGVDIPYLTNAEDLNPNSPPVIGGLILLKYGDVYHVAKILEFTDVGFRVVEGNMTPCVKEKRIIYYIDPFIRGFWNSK